MSELFIETTKGERFTILANRTWSILDLKKEIELKKGIKIHRQILSTGQRNIYNHECVIDFINQDPIILFESSYNDLSYKNESVNLCLLI